MQTEALELPAHARWFNPRSGEWTDAGMVSETTQNFSAPDDNDWVLCYGKDGKRLDEKSTGQNSGDGSGKETLVCGWSS